MAASKVVHQPVPRGYWLDARDRLMHGIKFSGDTEITKEEYDSLFHVPAPERRNALTKMREPVAEEPGTAEVEAQG